MSQQNSEHEPGEVSPPYILERYDASAGNNEVAKIYLHAENDVVAQISAAAHLQIAYPLTMAAFEEKRAIRLTDPAGNHIFGFE